MRLSTKILLTYRLWVCFKRPTANMTHSNKLHWCACAHRAHNTIEWIETSSNLHDHFAVSKFSATTKICPMCDFCCLIWYKFCNWLPSVALVYYSIINHNGWNTWRFANEYDSISYTSVSIPHACTIIYIIELMRLHHLNQAKPHLHQS